MENGEQRRIFCPFQINVGEFTIQKSRHHLT